MDLQDIKDTVAVVKQLIIFHYKIMLQLALQQNILLPLHYLFHNHPTQNNPLSLTGQQSKR